MSIRVLRKKIPGGGSVRYHPVMMAKVFTCGYMNRTCSCRLLAKALRKNVVYMRLSGNKKTSFKTVNEFRRVVLKDVMEEIFVAAVKLLAVKGYVKMENYFVDGTKTGSAGGRYSFVWKKTIGKNDNKPDGKLRAYVKACNEAADAEDAEYGGQDLEESGEGEVHIGGCVWDSGSAVDAACGAGKWGCAESGCERGESGVERHGEGLS